MYPKATKIFHRNVILIGLLLYCCIEVTNYNTAFNFATAVSLIAFVSFIALLYQSVDYKEEYYSCTRLFVTVVGYSSIMLLVFWWLSLYIDGDTFLFSKVDALKYQKISMKIKDLSYGEGISYLSKILDFDDWGAPIVMSTFLRIIPIKEFVNLCYVVIGGGTAVLLFKTGTYFMSVRYAYLASLAFCISSYSIFNYGCFLKETVFIFLVVCLFYFLTKHIHEGHNMSMFFVILFSVIICFFRPATVCLIWVGIFTYFLFRKGFGLKKLFMLTVIILIAMSMFVSLQAITDRYTNSGDIDGLLGTKAGTALSKEATYFVNFFASFFGPFPTIVANVDKLRTFLYGPGLLYKFFLNLPFWLAALHIIKNKEVTFFPMLVFIMIEATSVAIVQKGFEFRLNMPHTSFYYLIAFWYLGKIDETYTDDKQNRTLFHDFATPFYLVSFLIIFVWGTARG